MKRRNSSKLSISRPQRTEIDVIADRIAKDLKAKGETLESMLQALREERDRHG